MQQQKSFDWDHMEEYVVCSECGAEMFSDIDYLCRSCRKVRDIREADFGEILEMMKQANNGKLKVEIEDDGGWLECTLHPEGELAYKRITNILEARKAWYIGNRDTLFITFQVRPVDYHLDFREE